MVMDLKFFEGHDPTPSERWVRAITVLTRRRFRKHGLEVRINGRERLGGEPCLIACNATHQYDLVPMRYAFHTSGHPVVTLSKGKNYHGVLMRTFCTKLGSVPIVSRGYIIVMDFKALLGRKPEEAEYRALREHLDAGTPLPEGEIFDAMTNRPRTILGFAFDPTARSYRDTALALYSEMMGRTIALSRRAMEQGHDVQIFPQGSSSTRLSKGHIGAVQLAHALDVPIMPVGVNGCLTVLPRHRSMDMAAGLVHMRVGESLRVDLSALPDDFSPFDPAQERTFAAPLKAATQVVMERINGLLDPQYQWAEDQRSDGADGVRRFA